MKKTATTCLCLFLSFQIAVAQNVGIGTTTPNAKLDINGDVAIRSTTLTITSTYNYAMDVNTIKQSNYKILQNPLPPVGNFIIAGITAGADGRIITLTNRSGFSFEMYNDDAGALAANRVITGTGTTFAVYNGGAVTLKYDTAINRWEVISSHFNNLNYFGGAGWSLAGNAGTNASNFIGTTDNQPLRFKINGNASGIINPLNDNTALGYYSLSAVTTGQNNSALGSYALQSVTTGSNNTALGISSLFANTTGFKNTAVGAGSLAANQTGYSNTATGYSSLQSNTNGAENTSVGFSSLEQNTSGSFNSGFGAYALQSNTTGDNNIGLGHYSLSLNTTGYENVAVGNLALSSNTSGYANTAVGYEALKKNSNGPANSAFGYQALYTNTTGYCNSAFGYKALLKNSGSGNAAFGHEALVYNSVGYYNAALGTGALSSNTTGYENTAVGYGALGQNTYGMRNTAVGTFSLRDSTGSFNTSVGYGSNGTYSGDYNTIVGCDAYTQVGVGSYNTALGANAFHNINLTGINYCTALGNSAGPTTNFTNSISVGHDSHANGNDRAEIGSTFMQLIGGYKPWSTLVSDGRFKKNVKENVAGLDFIMQLHPVTYTVDYHALEKFKGIPSFEESLNHKDSLHKITPHDVESVRKMEAEKEASLKIAEVAAQSGFIAQDVIKAADNANYKFDGVNKPQHDKDNYSIAYSQFVVPLVKAVQEQQTMIEQLQKMVEAAKVESAAKIREQQTMIELQNKKIDELINRIKKSD